MKNKKLKINKTKLKKGDELIITRGKDKGKKGKIEKVFTKENTVLVPGINEYKRHMKARTQNEKSEIITITKPMHLENTALICPKCHKQTRVGYKIESSKEGSKKVRICRKCNKEI